MRAGSMASPPAGQPAHPWSTQSRSHLSSSFPPPTAFGDQLSPSAIGRTAGNVEGITRACRQVLPSFSAKPPPRRHLRRKKTMPHNRFLAALKGRQVLDTPEITRAPPTRAGTSARGRTLPLILSRNISQGSKRTNRGAPFGGVRFRGKPPGSFFPQVRKNMAPGRARGVFAGAA